MNHFLACAWWVIIRDSVHANEILDETPRGSVFDDYAHALFDAVLLMMGEKLDVYKTSERMVAFFVIIIMSVFVAVMFGEVALIVVSFNASQSKYRRKMTDLYEAMEIMELPMALQQRVLDFYDFIWKKHHSLNGQTALYAFMDEMSPSLSMEVQIFMCK